MLLKQENTFPRLGENVGAGGAAAATPDDDGVQVRRYFVRREGTSSNRYNLGMFTGPVREPQVKGNDGEEDDKHPLR